MRTKRIPRTSVILTKDACESLADNAIIAFLKDGTYFNCESVEQNGYFLDMTISFSQSNIPKLKEKNINTVLSVPLHFVLYMISGEARKNLGFSAG